MFACTGQDWTRKEEEWKKVVRAERTKRSEADQHKAHLKELVEKTKKEVRDLESTTIRRRESIRVIEITVANILHRRCRSHEWFASVCSARSWRCAWAGSKHTCSKNSYITSTSAKNGKLLPSLVRYDSTWPLVSMHASCVATACCDDRAQTVTDWCDERMKAPNLDTETRDQLKALRELTAELTKEFEVRQLTTLITLTSTRLLANSRSWTSR